MDESKLRELIKSIVRELNVAEDDDLEEITTTGDVAGYNTPHAFSDKKKDEKRRKKSAEVFGYKLVKEVEDIINEKDDDKGRKQYKPGDVWKRKDGTWAGKNSKGSIQGYKSKEDAEKWASNEVPSDEKENQKMNQKRNQLKNLKMMKLKMKMMVMIMMEIN